MKLPKIAAAAALLLSLVAAPADAQPVKTLPGQKGCAAHYLVAVPGGANTAEGIPDFVPHGGNVFMTGILTRAGTAGEIQPLWVSYPSTPFATTEYEKSKAGGLKRARTTVSKLANACPDAKFSFTGYSLGADIAATLTSDIANGRGPINPERVSGVALFANPHQGGNGAVLSRGTSPDSRGSLGSLPDGYGVLGPRVLEICRTDDLVCSMREAHRGLVSPAMRTNLAAGRVPLNEFNALFYSLGLQSFGVFRDIRSHGGYNLSQQREASNWIIQQSHAPFQIPVPELEPDVALGHA
ncbi:cutinase family protein [Corynebacterium sp. zg912]|uniref:Cutinase family protein n=1 Tax=Corynebacterium wankanglinii TaxID=2735136 RepID=A0A7H0KAA5_9CORY|nr:MULTISPECIES: cutinase family protein [Corynebacterium]MBA1836451.1 cutinase family protein [Corynebacterium wankanglinii]MCR5928448.1 cutinase family protein [Corynebacterium sp. zg912]QNP94221.1 cutinase family protein [Corynebacterium wankanglinii]